MTFHVVACCGKRQTVECRYYVVQYHINDIEHIIAVTGADNERKFEPTKDIPYLALMGELWGVCCENLCENSPRFHGTALYIKTKTAASLHSDTISCSSQASLCQRIRHH